MSSDLGWHCGIAARPTRMRTPGDVMIATLLKQCALPAMGLQRLTLALAVLLAVSAGHRPTAAQTFTEFPTPTANANPRGITRGPDGALWFTEVDATNHGR